MTRSTNYCVGFAGALSTFLALTFFLCRLSWDAAPSLSPWKATALTWSILGIAHFGRRVFPIELGATVALLLAVGLGWLTVTFGISTYAIIFPAAMATTIGIAREGKFDFKTLPIFLLFFGWIAGVLWSNAFFNSPFFFEQMLVENIDGDYFFGASGLNLFRTYGVATPGIDGAAAVPYHVGTRGALFYLSQWLGIPTTHALQVIYPIVVVPFFFFQFLNFISVVRRDGKPPPPIFWAFFAFAFVGFLPSEVLTSLIPPSYGWSRILTSDSYTLGLALFFAFLTWQLKHDNNPWAFLVLPWMVWLLGLVKISTAALFLLVIVYRFWRDRRAWLAILLSYLVFFWVARLTIPVTHTAWYPFHLLRVWVPDSFRPFYFLTHYFFALIFIGWNYLKVRPRAIGLDILLIVVLAGALPGLLIAIPDANAIFFAGDQEWLAVALILAHWPLVKLSRRQIAFGMILLAPFLYCAVANAVKYSAKLPRENKRIHNLTAVLRNSPDYLARLKLLGTFRKLDDMPLTVKRSQLLYVPTNHRVFWTFSPCGQMPFAAGALTGIAMLDGVPDPSCTYPAESYGYQYFPRRAEPRPNLSDPEICVMANARGFSKVLRLVEYEAQLVDCGKGT